MYKSELPSNCPPKTAYQRKIELYRLFEPNDLTESCKNHVELYPERKNYLTLCKAYSLSFFDTIEAVQDLLNKENNQGKKIAKVELEETFGKLSERSDKGHYSLWLYKDFDPSKLVFEFIDI